MLAVSAVGCAGPSFERPGQPSILRARGFSGRTDDGRIVTLLAIGTDHAFPVRGVKPDVWRPDGRPFANIGILRGVQPTSGYLSGTDIRTVAFAPLGRAVDAIGYAPDSTPDPKMKRLAPNAAHLEATGLHAEGEARPFALFAEGNLPSPSRYRIGIAGDLWRKVASTRLPHLPYGSEILLSGAWGRLRRRLLEQTKPTAEVGYFVEPATFPPAYEARVRTSPTRRTIEVWARRWRWVEFTGVHFRPRGVP